MLFQTLHARLWVRRAPGFPCALCSLGRKSSCTTRTLSAPRECEVASERHCEEQSDDPPSLAMRAMAGLESAEAPLRVGGSNPALSALRYRLLRFARNDGLAV